jgi:hypothetical protein
METNTLTESFLKSGGKLPEKQNNALEGLIFIPTWDNEPPPLKPVIHINGNPLLTYQNLSVLLAQPGFGKSSICEAILSKVASKEADAFGMDVDIKKALYIDCERTNLDVHASWKRMMQRGKLVDETDRVIFMGMRMIARLDQRKKAIEKALNDDKDIDLLIIDGAGDLVMDTNSLMEANELKVWLRELTSRHALSILTTLHPNPGDNKPRGHIGSELLREAESILAVEKHREIRKLTTEFKHGKNRNAGAVEIYFKYCDNEGMMIRATEDEYIAQGKADYQRKEKSPPMVYFAMHPSELLKLLTNVIGKDAYQYGELIKRIKEYIKEVYGGCSNGDNVIKAWISKLVDERHLIKKDGTKYSVYTMAQTGQQRLID